MHNADRDQRAFGSVGSARIHKLRVYAFHAAHVPLWTLPKPIRIAVIVTKF